VVTVVSDSVACLAPELRSKLGIGMVGICITLDGTMYHDGIDLTAEEFYARIGETISHTTASPSIGDWLEVMEQAIDDGADGLLVVTLPQKFSSTHDTACAAAKLIEAPTAVVDADTVAAAQGLYVRRLAEEAQHGATLDELVGRAQQRRGSYHLEFVVEGLRRLAHSGRMPSALARFGDAIDLKPMLSLGSGAEIRPVGAVRGMRRGIDRVYRRVLEAFEPDAPGRAVVSHALLEPDARRLAERIADERPNLALDIALFTPVMAATTGPIIGVAWEDPALAAMDA